MLLVNVCFGACFTSVQESGSCCFKWILMNYIVNYFTYDENSKQQKNIQSIWFVSILNSNYKMSNCYQATKTIGIELVGQVLSASWILSKNNFFMMWPEIIATIYKNIWNYILLWMCVRRKKLFTQTASHDYFKYKNAQFFRIIFVFAPLNVEQTY